MSTHPRPLDLSKVVRQVEQITGIRCGFPTKSDYERFHHIVELPGLCRDRLGHGRFCMALRIAREIAVRLAPLAFIVEAVRDHRRIVIGYKFGFEDADTASQFDNDFIIALAARLK